ncbi:Transposon TX1 uncharacterized protein [Nymphaea thermarum]|nr:Transposon TX1 uncharacterized protein [Nymphaea thermarum]
METPMASDEEFPPLQGPVSSPCGKGEIPIRDSPSSSSPGGPTDQGHGIRSWASLLSRGPLVGSQPEHPLEVEIQDGKFKIFIPKEAYDEMNRPFQWAALARNSHPKFTILAGGTFLIRVEDEQQLHCITQKQAWRVGGRTQVTFGWQPGQSLNMPPATSAPLWIRLPNLPPNMWTAQIFNSIAKGLRCELLEIDTQTRDINREGFARIRVELPLNAPLPPEFQFVLKDSHTLAQPLVYEGRLRFCRFRGINSHPPDKCPRRDCHGQGNLQHEAVKGKESFKVASSSKGPIAPGQKNVPTSKNQFSALMDLDESQEEEPTRSPSTTNDAKPLEDKTNEVRVNSTRRAKNKAIIRDVTENQTNMANPFYRSGSLPTEIPPPPPGFSFKTLSQHKSLPLTKAPCDVQPELHTDDHQASNFKVLFSTGGITHSRGRGSRLCGHRKFAQDTSNRSFANPDPAGPAGKRKRISLGRVDALADTSPPSQTSDFPTAVGEGSVSDQHENIDSFFIFDTLINADRLHINSSFLGSYATMTNVDMCDGVVRILCGWKPQRYSVVALNLHRFVSNCHLFPLSDPNRMFTWSNNRHSASEILCRLDWAFINNVWKTQWGSYTDMQILPRTTSDHFALKVSTRFIHIPPKRFGQFRYFHFWASRPQCKYLVQEAWSSRVFGCPLVRLIKKLEFTRSNLSSWARNYVGDIYLRIKALRVELDKVQSLEFAATSNDKNHEILIRKELQASLEDEDSLWRQRARVKWMAKGDRNTAFYQAIVKGRRTKNSLCALEHEGTRINDVNHIRSICEDFFCDLLGSQEGSSCCLTKKDDGSRLLDEDNATLLLPATLDEVKRVVFSMDGNSAPGPDGFPASFYQQHWSVIGHDLLQVINSFLSTGRLVKKVDRNYIALIPKKEGLCRVDDLRPIALCNVLCKIISKFLSYRMKRCLQKVISKDQDAFLPGRSITENIIFTHECIHSLEGLRQSNICFKIDFSKAYDRVSWVFLKNALLDLGFSMAWVDRVMMCVSSPSLVVLIDGISCDFHPMHRGDRHSYNEVMHALDALKLSSGLCVNPHKSHVISLGEQSAPLSFINSDWQQGSLPLPYLGTPLFAGNMQDNLCAPLVLKVEKKLSLWSSKLLSYEERLCLISLETRKGVHLVAWKTICRPVLEGGVGLKRLDEWNKACIGRITLRLCQDDAPWANFIKKKYLSFHSLWTLKRPKKESWFFKGVRKSWNQIQEHVRWSIGNGFIRFWTDNWGGSPLISHLTPLERSAFEFSLKFSIKQVLDSDLPILDNFKDFLFRLGMERPNLELHQDLIIWQNSSASNIKIFDVWEVVRKKYEEEPWRRLIWFPQAHPRAQ